MSSIRKVLFVTSLGEFVIQLDGVHAPQAVANFITYVVKGSYDNTLIHRVVKGVIAQAGQLTKDNEPIATMSPIINEADNRIKNKAYTVSMARGLDPHSATSQFFINLADNDQLDYANATPMGWGYAVFGRVIEGQNVIDKIGKEEVKAVRWRIDVPITPIVIRKVTLID